MKSCSNGRGRSRRSAPRSIPFDCNRGGKSKAQILNYGTTLWAVAEKCAWAQPMCFNSVSRFIWLPVDHR